MTVQLTSREWHQTSPAALAAGLRDTTDERVQQGGTDRHGSVHTSPVFCKACNDDDWGSNIQPSRCQVERCGNTAPGVIQEAAQDVYGPIVPHRGTEEHVALSRGERALPAKGIVR
jgi:hypothetical protein